MIWCGNREESVTSEIFVIDEWIEFSLDHQILCQRFEAYGPVIRLGRVFAPGVRVKIVYQVAAADNQNFFIAQRCERRFPSCK